MMKVGLVPLSMALAGGASIFSARPASAETSAVAGTWRGDSVCVMNSPSCHNESVVYYIKDVPGRPELVVIRADKIVDGKAITMGTGQWQYDRAQHTLEWRTAQQVWHLQVTGTHIEGTLRLADMTVFRNVRLEKSE